MSGADPQDRSALAAEYVLGTLSAHEAEAVRAALARDALLAAELAGWEQALAPLMRLAPMDVPPADLWSRIEARLPGPAVRATTMPSPVPSWGDRLVRWWAAGATAAAAGLAALLLVPNAPVPIQPGPAAPGAQTASLLTTVMVTDRTQTAWSATALPDGTLRITLIPPAGGAPEQAVPAGRVLQLWALPQGAAAPTSLAVLAPGQRSLTLTAPALRPQPGMLIELTLEPPGGSPNPRPSGPVQFIGRLPAAI